MDMQERRIIDDLFDKLRQAEQQSGPREPIAEAHIRSRIERQPGAPYYMAQTIVMQEQALLNAQARIAELEDELARRPTGGGFLSGLFGGSSQPQSRPPQRHPDNMQGMVPPGGGFGSGASGPAMAAQPGRGGGFLAGAAQTAMGVAGGMMIGSLLGSALGGDGRAKAAEAAQPAPAAQPAAASADEDFGRELGGDFGEDI